MIYSKLYYKNIICSVLFSLILFRIALLANYQIKVNVLYKINSEISYIMLLSLMFICLTFHTQIVNFWYKYKNTSKLDPPQFTYVDYFFSVTYTLIVLSFHAYINNNFSDVLKKIPYAIYSIPALLTLWNSYAYFTSDSIFNNIKPIQDYYGNKISDEPIVLESQDILKRNIFLNSFYKDIIELKGNISFVIGLYGKWGEGKTSFLNLLNNKLKDNRDYIVIKYNPWHYKDNEAILKTFYCDIEKSLSKHYFFDNIKQTFINYQKYISSGLTNAGIKLDINMPEETIEDVKKHIQNFIKITQKTYFVIIDDIDRLNINELLTVFKFINLNCNFNNMIFLLSLDPDCIYKQLTNNKISTEFLDKIIQIPVWLPPANREDIDIYLKENLVTLLKNNNISVEKLNNFIDIYNQGINKLFKNLRSIKRYLNELYFTYPSIKNEVNLLDYLLLSILKLFYSKIYNDILYNNELYTHYYWTFSGYQVAKYINEKADYSVNEKIKNNINSFKNDDQDNYSFNIMLKILKVLFPRVDYAYSNSLPIEELDEEELKLNKRLTHPNYFYKYFTLNVLPDELTDQKFDELFNILCKFNHEGIGTSLNNLIDSLFKYNQLYSFLEKLLLKLQASNDIKPDIFSEIIYSVYINPIAIKVIKKSLYDSKIHKLLDKINEPILKILINNLVSYIPDLYYLIFFIEGMINSKNKGIYKYVSSIDVNNLKIMAIHRIKIKYIDNNESIFVDYDKDDEWARILYIFATNFNMSEENKKIATEYVVRFIKNDPKLFLKFIMHMKDIWNPDSLAFRLFDFSKAYDIALISYIAKKHKLEYENISIQEKAIINQFLSDVELLINNKNINKISPKFSDDNTTT